VTGIGGMRPKVVAGHVGHDTDDETLTAATIAFLQS
jgi:hypothetical protein